MSNAAVAARTLIEVMKGTDAGERDSQALLIGLHTGASIAQQDPFLAWALIEQIEEMFGEAELHDDLVRGTTDIIARARGVMDGT